MEEKEGLESVRVDGKYRIELQTETKEEEPNTLTICSSIELSTTYPDTLTKDEIYATPDLNHKNVANELGLTFIFE